MNSWAVLMLRCWRILLNLRIAFKLYLIFKNFFFYLGIVLFLYLGSLFFFSFLNRLKFLQFKVWSFQILILIFLFWICLFIIVLNVLVIRKFLVNIMNCLRFIILIYFVLIEFRFRWTFKRIYIPIIFVRSISSKGILYILIIIKIALVLFLIQKRLFILIFFLLHITLNYQLRKTYNCFFLWCLALVLFALVIFIIYLSCINTLWFSSIILSINILLSYCFSHTFFPWKLNISVWSILLFQCIYISNLSTNPGSSSWSLYCKLT